MTKYKDGEFCPIVRGPCVERACRFWIMVRGTNANTGKEVDDWGCLHSWMPVLTIENTRAVKEMGAAIESFRNEMVRMNTPVSEEVLNDFAHRITQQR